MSGWVKLHRKITEWEWYTDMPCKVLFIHLLLTANIEEGKFMGQVIPKGSTATGLFSLAQQTGLSVQQVRTAINKLRATGEISIKSTNKFSVITINNYSGYQGPKTTEQQTDNKRITNEQQQLKKRRIKEEKNTTTTLCNFTPPTIEEVKGYCEQRANGIDPEHFVAHYTANGWMVGRTKMKNWQSAMITWEKRSRVHSKKNGTATKISPRQQYMEDVGNLLENIDEAANNGCPTRLGQAAQPLSGSRPQRHVHRKIGV